MSFDDFTDILWISHIDKNDTNIKAREVVSNQINETLKFQTFPEDFCLTFKLYMYLWSLSSAGFVKVIKNTQPYTDICSGIDKSLV